MKKIIIILCILACSCASQKVIIEKPYKTIDVYDEETDKWYSIEYYYDPNLND